jgi:hypothetical protein
MSATIMTRIAHFIHPTASRGRNQRWFALLSGTASLLAFAHREPTRHPAPPGTHLAGPHFPALHRVSAVPGTRLFPVFIKNSHGPYLSLRLVLYSTSIRLWRGVEGGCRATPGPVQRRGADKIQDSASHANIQIRKRTRPNDILLSATTHRSLPRLTMRSMRRTKAA